MNNTSNEFTFYDVSSEEECSRICESKFCHGMLYVEDKRVCRCLLCTGFLRE